MAAYCPLFCANSWPPDSRFTWSKAALRGPFHMWPDTNQHLNALLPGAGNSRALAQRDAQVASNLLAIVIQMLELEPVARQPGEPLFDDLAAARDFIEALFHRQLEIEYGVARQPLGNPLRHQRGNARRFLHHIAHQPVHRLLGPEMKAVGAQMLDHG